jgi:hypothetical protein
LANTDEFSARVKIARTAELENALAIGRRREAVEDKVKGMIGVGEQVDDVKDELILSNVFFALNDYA